jgi:hypothetical protein
MVKTPILMFSIALDFVWGVATSAYQIEGPVNEEGRGESIWNHFCHQIDTTTDASNKNVACDNSHRLSDGLLKRCISCRDFIKAQLHQHQLVIKGS